MKPDRTDSPDPDLLEHIRSLGLATVQDYVAWCGQYGFSRRTDKHWRLRMKERAHVSRGLAAARMAQKKQEVRHPAKVIERIIQGELHDDDVTQTHLKSICRACTSDQESSSTQLAFRQLVEHVSKCSDLIGGDPLIPQLGRQAGNTPVDGLLALARHSGNWLRAPSTWQPQTHNARRQFSSLARHLLAAWPVPVFMDTVWFLGTGRGAAEQQAWFLHVGSGENIRTADLPLRYTKRMAHHFMRAPSDLTVEAALRWGQIRGLGGTPRLAQAVLGTRLGTHLEQDEFWSTVLQFFIVNPLLDGAHLGPIIDYIHQQRFVPRDVIPAPGVVAQPGPAQPNFSMKGRTPASLLRQVEAWHGALAKLKQPRIDWPKSGIEGFEFVEGAERGGNLKIWTISELLSTKALVAEGRTLKHCVATYTHACATGRCSISALEVETFEGRAKVLTVEVQNDSRLIIQARGKCNMLLAAKHRGILRRWAEKEGLSLAKYV